MAEHWRAVRLTAEAFYNFYDVTRQSYLNSRKAILSAYVPFLRPIGGFR